MCNPGWTYNPADISAGCVGELHEVNDTLLYLGLPFLSFEYSCNYISNSVMFKHFSDFLYSLKTLLCIYEIF